MDIQRLDGKDIYLSKAKLEDVEDIWQNFWNDLESAKYMLWQPTQTKEDALFRMEKTINFQKNHFTFLIYEKSTNRAIGMAGFLESEPGVFEECGIGMGSKFTGRGYGTQVVLVLIDYLFNSLNAKKIIYSAMQQNIPSKKLAEKLGFKYTHSENKVREYDNFKFVCDCYEMTKEYYNNKGE